MQYPFPGRWLRSIIVSEDGSEVLLGMTYQHYFSMTNPFSVEGPSIEGSVLVLPNPGPRGPSDHPYGSEDDGLLLIMCEDLIDDGNMSISEGYAYDESSEEGRGFRIVAEGFQPASLSRFRNDLIILCWKQTVTRILSINIELLHRAITENTLITPQVVVELDGSDGLSMIVYKLALATSDAHIDFLYQAAVQEMVEDARDVGVQLGASAKRGFAITETRDAPLTQLDRNSDKEEASANFILR
ncbi:hypothetical protein FOL47_009339 [Perkinsus chesapeaki]|uniref:Uncharacterized protein n=1 Tax=Perkinsus chesapeaki TaxID=330153 RepID=A0A7J6L907_PERCH|nr:hypothetical protein FOL47_009339 [Perkinsus chesapeaki]